MTQCEKTLLFEHYRLRYSKPHQPTSTLNTRHSSIHLHLHYRQRRSHRNPVSILPFILLLLFSTTLRCTTASAEDVKPNVPWTDSEIKFILNHDLTDEFNDPVLNLSRWDEHGLRNPNSECPRWNGPPSVLFPQYSTFFPSTSHPRRSNKKVQRYRLVDGSYQMRIKKERPVFFKRREYYCDVNTFTCNHDPARPCFQTNIFGEPVMNETTGTYAGVSHDKCKVEPFCLPHHKKVLGVGKRPYGAYVSSHISSKIALRYGFVETRVKLANSSAVVAVWMHDDDSTGDTYCRFRKAESLPGVRQECPSAIRSRRWQEIDMVEQMNSKLHKKQYHPNIHVFAGNKGEYTSRDAKPDPAGMQTAGGPLIVRNAFRQPTPSFADIPEDQRITNDFHWNPASVADLETEWADNWRTVGLYWSPTEIRFFIDGKEVKRLDNMLVHQPMFLDISHALNVNWAKQEPTAKELRNWASIDYIRIWDMETPDGSDPPSSLGLDYAMREKFDDRYGRDLLDVFDRFPYADDLTVQPVDVKRPEKNSASGKDDNSEYFLAPIKGPGSTESGGKDVAWRPIKRETTDVKEGERGSVVGGGPGTKRATSSSGKGWRKAGSKKGANTYSPKKKEKISEFQKNAALSTPDRNARVFRKPDGRLKAEKLKEPWMTALDWNHPMGDYGPFGRST